MEKIRMDISIGSMLMNIVVSSLLLLYISLVLRHTDVLLRSNVKLLTLSIILVTIKLLFPFEFHFTRTYSTPLLGWISWFLYDFKVIPGVKTASLILFIWFAVALLKGIHTIFRQRKLYRQINIFPEYSCPSLESIFDKLHVKPALRKKLRIIQYPKAASPCIMGFFRPTILLPKEEVPYTEQELFYILKHELEHYYHHDIWSRTLVECLSIFYWWNPLVLLLRKQLVQASELSNDIKLSESLNERERVSYLECLLSSVKRQEARKEVQKENSQIFQYYIYTKQSSMKQRFLAILDYSNTKKSRFYNGLLLALILFSMVISVCIVIEPYYTAPDITAGTVLFTKDTTCLLDNQDGSYDIYLNNEYFGTIVDISKDVSKLKIYQTKREAMNHAKINKIRFIYRTDGDHIIYH